MSAIEETTEERVLDAAHPADVVDVQAAADMVAAWLLGEGPHWDPFIRDHRPEMQSPDQTLDYTMEGIRDHAFHERGIEYDEEDLEPHSPMGRTEIAAWCLDRALTARKTLTNLPIVDGGMRAHRLIGTSPDALRADLGIFWTHSLHETVDIYAMWAPDGRDAETLCVEAVVPLESIDWQTSCMALMDWYLGDSEQELRLRPGHPVSVRSCIRWKPPEEWVPDEAIVLPDLDWRT
jgi:hypothetical protein